MVKKPEIDSEKVKSGLRRAMWLFMAALFLMTGVVFTVIIVWQSAHQDNSQSNTTQQKGPNCTNDPSIVFNGTGSSASSAKLAGQQLADFTPTPSIKNFSCIDVKQGTGNQTVQSTSTIIANYTGAVAATGKIFQSSLDNNGQPFSTQLSGVIPGWQVGLIGVSAGGERRLLIPASLAYGANPPQGSGIPANADLVFDITIISIQ